MSSYRPRILIVDDDQDSLANLGDILAEAGYETLSARNGLDALDKLAAENPDDCPSICVLDFKMPEMNGIELLEKIRLQQPRVQAILTTAYAGDDGLDRADEAGAWRILPKPVDIKLLLESIREAVA